MVSDDYTIDEMVQLALDERAAGNLEASNKWIWHAERMVLPHDTKGLTALWSAMRMGLGGYELEVGEEKAMRYIIAVANADNWVAQEIVMIDYLEGLNGFPQDFERFRYWAERAKALGSTLAVKELKKFERKNKRAK